MRIMILTNADIGLYKFRKELLEQLCSNNEVFNVLPRGKFVEQLESLGCVFIPFEFNRRGVNPFADCFQIARYVKILRKIKPEIVLTYTIKPNVYGGIACRITKTPYIANITGLGTTIENGGLFYLISTNLYRIGLKKTSCVFFQNADNQRLFIDKGIVKGRTRLIPGSGVNLQQYKYEPYPSDDLPVRFLFVGRIMRDKGIDELLESMQRIKRENRNVTLDIVGWCDEEYSTILNIAQEKGLIHYHGLQTDVHPFYAQCNCVILPSYHEGMANVMLEASSTGRPVITTRVPGCKETFDEGVTGFGCDAKSTDSLFDAMSKFLNINHETRKQMGIAARNKMKKEFDRSLVISAYIEEIDKATRGQRVSS